MVLLVLQIKEEGIVYILLCVHRCIYDSLLKISSKIMRCTLDLLSVFLLMSTGLSYLTSEEVVGIILILTCCTRF